MLPVCVLRWLFSHCLTYSGQNALREAKCVKVLSLRLWALSIIFMRHVSSFFLTLVDTIFILCYLHRLSFLGLLFLFLVIAKGWNITREQIMFNEWRAIVFILTVFYFVSIIVSSVLSIESGLASWSIFI